MIYDITVTISPESPVYPGDPQIEVTPVSRISAGAGANVSVLRLGTHTGTHVDPPFHFIEGGLTIDRVPLEILVGECHVVPVPDVPAITTAELQVAKIPEGTERVLLKTRNSDLWRKPGFQTDYTYLEPDAADWLVGRGVKLVGTDYLSIERLKSGSHPTHTRLLGSGVVIVEGLDLADVPGGIYTLVCLPLKILDGDGGPARAILIA